MDLRKGFFEYYYHLKGRQTFECHQMLEKTQYLPLKEIEEIQYKKLRKLIYHAYKRVPFYKKLFKNLDLTPDDFKSINDIKKIPIITKEDISSNLGDMVSSNYTKNYLKPNSTGGSTGYNLKFFNDLKRAYIRQAFVMRGNSWAGLTPGTKQAFLWGSQFDESLQNSLKGNLLNKIFGSIFLSSYELSDLKIRQYLEKLNDFKPEVLIAYPSALYTFSKFIEDNNIDSPNLKSIITSAETLYDFQREKIESTLQCRIYNRYGCREFGPIAHECSEHHGLHMNLEHLFIEFAGINDYEINEGDESSKIIITDLDNYAMPFIRYEIGDLGEILDYDCSCGRNLPLMKVEGRTFDVIVGTNGNRLGGTFWTLLFRTFIRGIEEFQVIQESKDKLIINIVVGNFNNEKLLPLENKIKEFCGSDMSINFQLVDHIDKTKSGKFRFIISKL